jgi:crotonobetainyl-CoA:carnitine CoA-transferase CaiB-like acyl-CoA transferase
MDKILKNIRILDMTEGVAGPYASALLGDMGASVIKIERPEGDWGRGTEEPLRPSFIALNRNKRNVCLDLQNEGAKSVITRLVQRTDVVLSNYRKGVMERLGVGYEDCRKMNPGVIYCTVSGFGQKGRYSVLPASDTGLQAMSGIMELIGEPEGPQMRVSFPLVDLFAASFATQGILLAIYARQQGKGGTRIDVSLINAAMALQAMPFTNYLMTQELPKRYGNQNPVLCPAGAFRTKDDKYMTITVLSQAHWERLCQTLGQEKLLTDPRFQTNSLRIKNRSALNALLTPIFLGKTRGEWIPVLTKANILTAPINTYEDIRQDPGMMEALSLLKFKVMGKEVQSMGNPIEIDGGYPKLELPPPLKGQHTMEILEELGYSQSEVQKMVSEGVVYGTPPI